MKHFITNKINEELYELYYDLRKEYSKAEEKLNILYNLDKDFCKNSKVYRSITKFLDKTEKILFNQK